MKTIVRMNAEGRITVPTEARKELGLLKEAELQVETTPDAIILKPVVVLPREDAWASVVVLPREDAWAYTAPHRRLLAKAHRDSREGRVRRVSERQLERLGR